MAYPFTIKQINTLEVKQGRYVLIGTPIKVYLNKEESCSTVKPIFVTFNQPVETKVMSTSYLYHPTANIYPPCTVQSETTASHRES